MITKKNLKIKEKEDVKITPKKGTIKAVRPLHIAEDLSWNFGEDVMVYDVKEKTPYVSYYIVASATNERRLNALVQTAKDSLYDNYKDIDHTEGGRDSEWVLIDCKDIVVQLFTKKERERVAFDKLYQDCPHLLVKATKEPSYKKRKPKTPLYPKEL